MFVSNNFDIPNLGEPYERKILLRNSLKSSVIFKIRQSCQLSLKISPTIGIISKNSTRLIKIQYAIGFRKLVNNDISKHFDIFVRLFDNKNKGIIYKWLKNEISEPNHLAHRFIITPKIGYISSTFVFDIPCKASILEPVLFPTNENEDDNCKTAIQIDEGTEAAQKIIHYPPEFLYNNNTNNSYHNDYNHLDRNHLNEFNEVTYNVENNQNKTSGIIYAAINYLFGQKNDDEDSLYTYGKTNKKYGFIC